MVLKATNIHKYFGSLQILKGVDMEVQKGEIVSIIGKSGSGKSTLLHILGTLDSADKGQIHIRDTDISKLSSNALSDFRNRYIGFIFQFHHLLPEFTALENVCIPGFVAGTPTAKVKNRATELLAYLGLQDRLQHKPSQLSGGEQQRVAVARALVNSPEIIFADEPTGNLDSSSASDFLSLIQQLRDDYGQAFVLVTHNMELAGLSNRCLEMKDGLLSEWQKPTP